MPVFKESVIFMHDYHPCFQSVLPFTNVLKTLGCAPFPNQIQFDQLIAFARKQKVRLPERLRFVLDLEPVDYYEVHIATTGEVPTRSDNWHDLLNALAWCAFPLTKTEITSRHLSLIQENGLRIRGKGRDALTLLDECGVLLPYSEDLLAHALENMDWQTLFVESKAAWGKQIDAWVLGHASLEKSLAPYIGWCDKALLIKVEASFFALDSEEQRAFLDHYLADQLKNPEFLTEPKDLLPLPMLGIPNWHEQQDAAFYANQGYFRSKRWANSVKDKFNEVKLGESTS